MVYPTLKYDPQADAFYLKVREGIIGYTDSVNDEINIDFDLDGKVIGIEVLDASVMESDVVFEPQDDLDAMIKERTLTNPDFPTMVQDAIESLDQLHPFQRAKFPHCDELVIHSKNFCKWCDMFPEAQQERIERGINFTGEYDPEKTICPSEIRRSLTNIEKWGGNIPRT